MIPQNKVSIYLNGPEHIKMGHVTYTNIYIHKIVQFCEIKVE